MQQICILIGHGFAYTYVRHFQYKTGSNNSCLRAILAIFKAYTNYFIFYLGLDKSVLKGFLKLFVGTTILKKSFSRQDVIKAGERTFWQAN